MLSRGGDIEIEPYYCLPIGTTFQNPLAAHANAASKAANVPWSQPTSPTPPSRFSNGPMSPTHAYRLTYPKKNDDGMFARAHTHKMCYLYSIKMSKCQFKSFKYRFD